VARTPARRGRPSGRGRDGGYRRPGRPRDGHSGLRDRTRGGRRVAARSAGPGRPPARRDLLRWRPTRQPGRGTARDPLAGAATVLGGRPRGRTSRRSDPWPGLPGRAAPRHRALSRGLRHLRDGSERTPPHRDGRRPARGRAGGRGRRLPRRFRRPLGCSPDRLAQNSRWKPRLPAGDLPALQSPRALRDGSGHGNGGSPGRERAGAGDGVPPRNASGREPRRALLQAGRGSYVSTSRPRPPLRLRAYSDVVRRGERGGSSAKAPPAGTRRA
jgi:hypothetical protein